MIKRGELVSGRTIGECWSEGFRQIIAARKQIVANVLTFSIPMLAVVAILLLVGLLFDIDFLSYTYSVLTSDHKTTDSLWFDWMNRIGYRSQDVTFYRFGPQLILMCALFVLGASVMHASMISVWNVARGIRLDNMSWMAKFQLHAKGVAAIALYGICSSIGFALIILVVSADTLIPSSDVKPYVFVILLIALLYGFMRFALAPVAYSVENRSLRFSLSKALELSSGQIGQLLAAMVLWFVLGGVFAAGKNVAVLWLDRLASTYDTVVIVVAKVGVDLSITALFLLFSGVYMLMLYGRSLAENDVDHELVMQEWKSAKSDNNDAEPEAQTPQKKVFKKRT